MYKLEIIIASTRPGRVGTKVAEWFIPLAKAYGKFDVEVADLAEVNLPFLDEPNHPRLQQYTKEHTKAWSQRIEAADAFVIITPEYNFSAPAPLINALDYLYKEWNYKPVGFVSYGGLSGGTRSVQHIKAIVTTLKMIPLYEAVNIPFVHQHLNDDGTLMADEHQQHAAEAMLRDLNRWAEATQKMRESQPA